MLLGSFLNILLLLSLVDEDVISCLLNVHYVNLEDLVLVGFGFLLFILSCTSSDHCLFVGFYPPSHIILLFPLSLPSLSGKWRSGSITSGSAQVFCHKSGTACASNASDRVVTALDATPAPRCNIEH